MPSLQSEQIFGLRICRTDINFGASAVRLAPSNPGHNAPVASPTDQLVVVVVATVDLMRKIQSRLLFRQNCNPNAVSPTRAVAGAVLLRLDASARRVLIGSGTYLTPKGMFRVLDNTDLT